MEEEYSSDGDKVDGILNIFKVNGILSQHNIYSYMKYVITLLLGFLFFFSGCSSCEVESDSNGVTTMGGIPQVIPISFSLEGETLHNQIVFHIGAEGGALRIVAYYPETLGLKRLDDIVDTSYLVPSEHFNFTRTKRSELQSVYSFMVEKNITGKPIVSGAYVVDSYNSNAAGHFVILQSAE